MFRKTNTLHGKLKVILKNLTGVSRKFCIILDVFKLFFKIFENLKNLKRLSNVSGGK